MENNNNVQVLVKTAATSPSRLTKFLASWPINKKIIFLLLGLVAILEIVLMIRAISVNLNPFPRSVERLQKVSGAKIVLDTSKTNYQLGDEVLVTVRVATGGHTTDGIDLVLRYDNKILEASGSGVFTPGQIYTEYPPVIINNVKGEIRVSGLTGAQEKSFIGVGNFGQIKFKAIANGSTKISTDFQTIGSTVDTNVTETKTAKDLLEKSYDLSVTVGQTSSSETKRTSSENSCAEYVQVCQDGIGHQGTQTCARGLKSQGVCQWDPYLTLDCTNCQITN